MKRTDFNMMKVKQFSDKDIPGQNEERGQPVMDNDVIEASGQENKKKPEAGLRSKEGSDDKQQIKLQSLSALQLPSIPQED